MFPSVDYFSIERRYGDGIKQEDIHLYILSFLISHYDDIEKANLDRDDLREPFLSDFRRKFCDLVNSGTKLYRLSSEDKYAELKALLILVSIAMMDVSEDSGDETTEIIPFLQALMQSQYFSSSLRALSALLLNVATVVVSKSSTDRSLGIIIEKFLTFLLRRFQNIKINPDEEFFPGFEIFSENETSSVQKYAARAVQYSCITVLFQLVGQGFTSRSHILTDLMDERIAMYQQSKPNKVSRWSGVVSHYKAIFDFSFDGDERDHPRAGYQIHFGFYVYCKYLMLLGERLTPIPQSVMTAREQCKDWSQFPSEFRKQVRSLLFDLY